MYGSFTQDMEQYTKTEQLKTLAKVEEFENGNLLLGKFEYVNS